MSERPGVPGDGVPEKWDAWRNVLALLRIGFALDDVRRMTMQDFIAYADLAYDDHSTKTKEATQADIDALLG